MSVPSQFTPSEAARARDFILARVAQARFRDRRVVGDPYVTYGELASHMGYTLDDEWDGDRMGLLAATAAELERPLTGLLLSAVVIRADPSNHSPGHGFYAYAQQQGKFTPTGAINPNGQTELAFWVREVDAIVKHYGR